MRYVARVADREFAVEVTPKGGGRFSVTLDGKTREIERRGDGALLVLSMDGEVREAAVAREGTRGAGGGGTAAEGESSYSVVISGRPYAVTLADPLRRPAPAARPAAGGPAEVRSIMPGKITTLLVEEGQEVRQGQGVVVVEAMKMENELPAPKDGRVTKIRVRPGETVEAGAILFVVES